MFMELLVRGEGMPTFGQRVKNAWKNINDIKPKNNEIKPKRDKNKQTYDYLENIISLSYSIILFSRKSRDTQETIYQRIKIQFQLGNHRIPILKSILITGLLQIITSRKQQLNILKLIFELGRIQQDPYAWVNFQISFLFQGPLRISDNRFQFQILKEYLANHNSCIRLYSNQYLE